MKNLASIGCPTYEIASVMNVSARTLKRNFAEIITQYKEQGKASLRKKMYDKAVKKDNTMMQIFLSKNMLGMSDKVQQTNVTEPLPLIIEAQAEDGIRDRSPSRGLGDVYKRQFVLCDYFGKISF